MRPLSCKEALQLLLDQVDFRKGACSLTEMVGACISDDVFKKCDEALAADSVCGADQVSEDKGVK